MLRQRMLDLADAELQNGDMLSSEEFMRRWEAYPNIKFAELINGIVYIPLPFRGIVQGEYGASIICWMGTYSVATPGSCGCSNATWLMTEKNVPQPDSTLRILPKYGGQSRIEGLYFAGAPELIGEVCRSNTSFELHQKLEVYQEAGVQEYVTVLMREREICWHRLVQKRLEAIPIPSNGIHQSTVFPGLWLDAAALLDGNLTKVFATVQQGLATPEHAAFVAELARRRKPTSETELQS